MSFFFKVASTAVKSDKMKAAGTAQMKSNGKDERKTTGTENGRVLKPQGTDFKK